jgi:hypothetical protein
MPDHFRKRFMLEPVVESKPPRYTDGSKCHAPEVMGDGPARAVMLSCLDVTSEFDPMKAAQCACGHVHFDIRARPRFRARCHCTICQRFNQAPFGDIVVFRAGDVDLPPAGTVEYAAYRPPPNVQRGVCSSCAQPVLERFESPLFPKLRFVPAALIDPAELPKVSFDVFYERRVADIDDGLPKYTGYLRSQLAFMKQVLFPPAV